MKHLFVSKEISSKLYKLGFEEYCMGGYYDGIFEYSSGFIRNTTFADENNVTAPLYQQVFDWIRETYKINISLFPHERQIDKWDVELQYLNGNKISTMRVNKFLNICEDNYKSASEKGILQALNLIK